MSGVEQRPSLSSIFTKARISYRGVPVLSEELGSLCSRDVTAGTYKEATQTLRDITDKWLKPHFTHHKTLVITGASGTGKTCSALALASNPLFLCFYLMVSSIRPLDSIAKVLMDCCFDESTREMVKEPLAPSPPGTIAVIIVDEIGASEALAVFLCTPDAVDTLRVESSGLPLAQHLGVDRIQLVAAGTGALRNRQNPKLQPAYFDLVVMDAERTKDVVRNLENVVDAALPWLKTLPNETCPRPTAGDPLLAIEAMKTNARMFTWFANTAHYKAVTNKLKIQKDDYYATLDTFVNSAIATFLSWNALGGFLRGDYPPGKYSNRLQKSHGFTDVLRSVWMTMRTVDSSEPCSYIMSRVAAVVDNAVIRNSGRTTPDKRPRDSDGAAVVLSKMTGEAKDGTKYVTQLILPAGVPSRFTMSPAYYHLSMNVFCLTSHTMARPTLARLIGEVLWFCATAIKLTDLAVVIPALFKPISPKEPVPAACLAAAEDADTPLLLPASQDPLRLMKIELMHLSQQSAVVVHNMVLPTPTDAEAADGLVSRDGRHVTLDWITAKMKEHIAHKVAEGSLYESQTFSSSAHPVVWFFLFSP